MASLLQVMVDIREKTLVAIRFLRHVALTGFAAGMLLILCGLMAAKANEPVTVKVGAYEYGVVYFYEHGRPRGMVPHLIRLLNDVQNEYVFELAETSSRRRYQAVSNGEVDLILLENSQWEWQEFDVRFSEPIVQEKDLYLTLAGRDDIQSLLSNVTNHPILCVLGFHYGFAGFKSDPAYLRQNFDVLLRYNEKEVLEGLLADKAPIGIVSAGFLAAQFVEYPALRDSLVIADQPDAIHDLVSVLSASSSITLERFNELIAQLHSIGEVERLWQQLHIGLSG
jgi:ABC-type amino acid transport substrate-binding protein